MLKTTLHHFEVLFRAKDRNADLIRLVKDVIHECRCLNKMMLNYDPGTYKGEWTINFFKRIFLSAPAVFSSFMHVSVSHIMAKFDMKCMFFTFFPWKSTKRRQAAYLILFTRLA